jgi:hypothetical protein
MLKVIIDRFEGDRAILEIKEGVFVDAPAVLFPDAVEGDVIIIKKDEDLRKAREGKIDKLMKEIFIKKDDGANK